MIHNMLYPTNTNASGMMLKAEQSLGDSPHEPQRLISTAADQFMNRRNSKKMGTQCGKPRYGRLRNCG